MKTFIAFQTISWKIRITSYVQLGWFQPLSSPLGRLVSRPVVFSVGPPWPRVISLKSSGFFSPESVSRHRRAVWCWLPKHLPHQEDPGFCLLFGATKRSSYSPWFPPPLLQWPHSPPFSWDKALSTVSGQGWQCWPWQYWPWQSALTSLVLQLFLVHPSFQCLGSESLPGSLGVFSGP